MAAAQRLQDFFAVHHDGLPLTLFKDLDLYVNIGQHFFLLKPKGLRQIEAHKKNLIESTDQQFFIPIEQRADFIEKHKDYLKKELALSSLSPSQKAGLLVNNVSAVVEDLYRDPANHKIMVETQLIMQDCVDFILQQPNAFLNIIDKILYSPSLLAHSMAVATYSIVLSRALNPSISKQELHTAGLAGLLHDIGKSLCPIDLLDKNSSLTADEWEQIKKHTIYGAEILRQHKNLPEVVSLVAESHHESFDGSGYPKGMTEKQLCKLVEIINLADSFSAITQPQSWTSSKDTFSALKLLKGSIGQKFHPEIYYYFVPLFSALPQSVKH